ncbi:MAG: SDR family NAD(P)-dependent oxidoreductase, partial [Clostridia bacterium]|nr:SDR family NAD(P)-dependent oxidoreductase [Clostridia bacterium]
MLQKKTALVTGASRGIGRGISTILAKNGIAVCGVGTKPADAVAEYENELKACDADSFYLQGDISKAEDRERIKRILVNPASAAELPLFTTETLPPQSQHTDDDWMPIRDFRNMDTEALMMFAVEENFSMSSDDLRFVQSYFRVEEKRDPLLFEMRMIDTYWSDHCRHITFLTAIQDLCIEDP